jgi:hypothetical protein
VAARPRGYGIPYLRLCSHASRCDPWPVERVALAQLVNAEIRALAARFDLPGEVHRYAWLCACGCSTLVHASLDEYDASAGEIFAAGHPAGAERAQATAAFRHEPDPAAVTRRVDQRRRRELTAELAERLERQVMAGNGT